MHPRGFHYFIFILMVKRILLLALKSSRTAAVGRILSVFGLVLTSWVGPGKRATFARDLCLSLSLSLAVDPSV